MFIPVEVRLCVYNCMFVPIAVRLCVYNYIFIPVAVGGCVYNYMLIPVEVRLSVLNCSLPACLLKVPNPAAVSHSFKKLMRACSPSAPNTSTYLAAVEDSGESHTTTHILRKH